MFTNGIFLISFSVWREWKNKVVFTLSGVCVMLVPSQLRLGSSDTPGLSNKGICSRCQRRMFKWRSSGEISLPWCVCPLSTRSLNSFISGWVQPLPRFNLTCFLWYQALSCRIWCVCARSPMIQRERDCQKGYFCVSVIAWQFRSVLAFMFQKNTSFIFANHARERIRTLDFNTLTRAEL